MARFEPVHVVLRDGRAATVRPLTRDDGPRLGDFYVQVPAADFRFYCPHPLTREEALTKAAQAEAPAFVCLVLELADASIGGYAWYRWREATAERSGFGICIRRDVQGSGAGQALMTHLLKLAETIGPPRMGLTVQKANPRAVALYRQMGFTVVREQVRARDNEPEYYMERAVRPGPVPPPDGTTHT